ncbi:hypothetical protein RHMOL_Rhmol06G0279100 [Rhododendron molle]|uniref:Uncharacterized protein n=1 Tax=Rhododendron molle TaxID=49168 RepID=A0ACC0NHB3_RHOML|nr:hypothetical protein RHMOL_Rhmol06G0279100 [Rhododendron molle]
MHNESVQNDYLILYFINLSSVFPYRREVKKWGNTLFSGLRKQDLNSRKGTLILALWTGLSTHIVLTDPLRTKNRTPTKDAPSGVFSCSRTLFLHDTTGMMWQCQFSETNSSPRLPLRQQPIPSLPVRQIWDLSSLMSKTPTNYLLLTSTEGQPLEVLRLVWVGFS